MENRGIISASQLRKVAETAKTTESKDALRRSADVKEQMDKIRDNAVTMSKTNTATKSKDSR